MNNGSIFVKLASSVTLKGKLSMPEKVGGEQIVTPPAYEGEYEITPTLNGGTLQTKDKYMEEDLIIKPIPITETENAAGGKTIIIG